MKNTNILKQIAEHFKVSEEKVVETYNESKAFVEKQFPKADDKTKESKILTITTNKFKTNIGGNTFNYKGIVIGVSGIQDSNNYQRKTQLEIYNKAKEEAERTGDASLIDNLIDKVVKIDSEGSVTPLFPFYKKDGTQSAMAGKIIPGPEESSVRMIIGMAYAEGKNPEEELKVFNLSLKGKALNNIPSLGKIVSFKAGGKVYNDEYQLNSSVTDFVETTDDYLQEGLDNVGVEGMVEKIFEKKIITYDTIENWVKEFKETGENPIPKELKYSYVVVNNSNCMSQNFQPNDKGKISMNFCNDEFSLDNNVTLITSTLPEIGDKIEFAASSTCVVIGNLSIFGKEGEEPMTWMKLFGAIAHKDTIVPRQFDAKPLGEDVTETKEEVSEKTTNEKSVTKAW